MRRHGIAKAARRTECQAEEFQLVRRGFGTVSQQVQATLAHFRIRLIRHQFKPVVERADRTQQIMAQARAEQAGKIDAVDRIGHEGSLPPEK